MWTGDRCGMNCGSSTTSPATVYFPQGFVRSCAEHTVPLTFQVTAPIWYRTAFLPSITRRSSVTLGNHPPSSRLQTLILPHLLSLVSRYLLGFQRFVTHRFRCRPLHPRWVGSPILRQSKQLVGRPLKSDLFVIPADRSRSFRAIKNLVIDTTRVPPHVV